MSAINGSSQFIEECRSILFRLIRGLLTKGGEGIATVAMRIDVFSSGGERLAVNERKSHRFVEHLARRRPIPVLVPDPAGSSPPCPWANSRSTVWLYRSRACSKVAPSRSPTS